MSHTVKLHADVGGENIEVTVGYDAGEDVTVYEVLDGRVDITSMLTESETAAIDRKVRDVQANVRQRNREDRAAARYDDLREDV